MIPLSISQVRMDVWGEEKALALSAVITHPLSAQLISRNAGKMVNGSTWFQHSRFETAHK